MVNKDKFKQTVYLNGMTLKELAAELGMNYQVFLRHINKNTIRLSTVNKLISILDFTLYTPFEVFFDGSENLSVD